MRSAPSVSPSSAYTTKTSRSEPVVSSRPPSLPRPTTTAEMKAPSAVRGEKALELVQGLVGIPALPHRVEQRRQQPGERLAERGRVGHERPAFEDETQVVTRALGIGEARRLQGQPARQPRPERTIAETLAKEITER